MKYLALAFLVTVNTAIMAQEITTDDVIGVYHLPTNNPEGGQSFAVFPDYTFVSVYFGGIIKGTWKIKDGAVHFTISAEPKIALYGRRIEALKDTTQLDFGGNFSRGAKVNLEMEAGNVMQNIFNKGANCKAYPYIYKTRKSLRKIAFAISDGARNGNQEYFKLFTFEIPESYNDIIAINLPAQYTTENEFVVNYENGGLYFNSGSKPASKSPLSRISMEDMSFYKRTTKRLLSDTISYNSELFPYVEDPTEEMLLSFYVIAPTSIIRVKEKDIKIKPTSMYTAVCD